MIIQIFDFLKRAFSFVRESFLFRKIVSFYQPFTWKKGLGTFVAVFVLVAAYYRIFDDAICISGDCKNSLSKMEFRNGDVYEGMFVDSKPQGFGAFWGPKGDYYQGGWFRGMKHGVGKYVYPNGTEYIGDFVFNKKEGHGIFKWQDGTILNADWIGDHPQGKGVLTLPDSRKLHGYYQRGFIYDGNGVFIYNDGSKYIGSWKAGQRHGFGVLFASNGMVSYKGLWREDKPAQPFVKPDDQPEPSAAEEAKVSKVLKKNKKKGKNHE
ncbi:hypothetical protein EHQ53_17655 [Leptospira langatensis]|uniref:Membrane-binding protein n=1 Tax=Leptospira langatensis TaxID=2484983 RepID=A0A5F1ZNM6_9LEPT|nr:hypothetical protein [Leptospira langatensis]TGK05458.1 hypothetical protein EHO57_01895 [Leptospira langatensis]TGL38594.1 hypothetical protein EHQ53_17655 [Leptospira langatensis]